MEGADYACGENLCAVYEHIRTLKQNSHVITKKSSEITVYTVMHGYKLA